MTKSFANSGEVMVSWVGMKMPCLERWSMITRMEEEGKVFNEIHGDGVPRSLWHRELLEESIEVMMRSLSTSTSHLAPQGHCDWKNVSFFSSSANIMV